MQVYVPASDGSGLVIVSVDTRDGTSTSLPFAAAPGDPSENTIWYFPVPPVILRPLGPSQMRELSGRMYALISQDSTAAGSSDDIIIFLSLDCSSTVKRFQKFTIKMMLLEIIMTYIKVVTQWWLMPMERSHQRHCISLHRCMYRHLGKIIEQQQILYQEDHQMLLHPHLKQSDFVKS